MKSDEQIMSLEVMSLIRKLMKNSKINTRVKLAKELNVSKNIVDELFSGSRIVNITLLAKFQIIFNMRFGIKTE